MIYHTHTILLRYIVITSIYILYISTRLNAQGCSDAGFCTLPGLNPNEELFFEENQIQFGVNYGAGDLNTNIIGLNIMYHRNISGFIKLGIKATYQSVNGPIGTVSGISDLFITSNIKMNKYFTFTMGFKFPFNKSDIGNFPMEYQPSVGTLDLVTGINYQRNGAGISAGLQQPMNQNHFSIDSIQNYNRKGDILLRLFYNWKILGDRITLTPSFLNIFHLDEDSYEYENGIQSDIKGSAGLTLNANLYATWHVNQKFDVEFLFAMPFIVRDVRPDGLTRSFVTGLEIIYKF